MSCVSETQIIKALLYFDLKESERFRDWINKKGKAVRQIASHEKKVKEDAENLASGQIVYGLGKDYY